MRIQMFCLGNGCRRTHFKTLLSVGVAFALLGIAFAILAHILEKAATMDDIIAASGTPVFTARRATLSGGHLTLIDALQIDSGARRDGPLTTSARPWLILCNDPLKSECLKVLHAGSITLSDSVLSAEPVAGGLGAMRHPFNALSGTVTLVSVNARGEVDSTSSDLISDVQFIFTGSS